MDYLKTLLKKKSILTILAIVIVVGGYFGYKTYKAKTAKATYVTSPVQKGTLTVSVSGTGQVSSSNQIDLKPTNAGTVTSVSVKQGQTVAEGDIIAQIDAKDAATAVRDAQNNLESAQLALQKLAKPAGGLSLMQSQNALTSAQQSAQSASDSLNKSYDDAFNSISDSFLDLPTIMTGLNDILAHGYLSESSLRMSFGNSAISYRTNAEVAYDAADLQFQATLKTYKATSRQSGSDAIESLITGTYNTSKTIADAVKTTKLLVDFVRANTNEGNLPNGLTADQSTLESYTSEASTHLSSLLSGKNSIQTDKDNLQTAQNNVAEKTQSLSDVQSGADPLDIRADQLKVSMAQNALSDAESKLGDYTIRAPISGVIAALNIHKGDQSSSATAAATIVTQEKIAEISLNEVDVAKIKVGQKTTLTFDAIPDLTITGTVAQIDTIGTVTQGVVSYKVEIGFDTQEDQIKPGMSVSAAIITDVKQDVLIVPSSAVKTQGQNATVDVLVNGQPQTKSIQVGASNDTDTEVSGDINEGDAVITQTILPNAKTSTSATARTTTGIPGLGGGAAGGGARAGGFGGAGGATRGGGG